MTDEACATGLLPPRTVQGTHADPAPGLETVFAGVLAGVLKIDRVSVEAHFFDDLGADSLLMAQFCSRARKLPEVPALSMKDVYRNLTLRRLAAALAPPPALPGFPAAEQARIPAQAQLPPPEPAPARPATTGAFLLCGALQLVVFLASALLTTAVAVAGYTWTAAGTGLLDDYVWATGFGVALAAGLFALPVLTKWLLVGRWKPTEIRVWSLGYVRFWLVKLLVQKNPLVLFMVGTPLYVLYLRVLGAKIGPGVTILSRNVPACTDLLTVGADTVVSKDSFFSCYQADSGMIRTGRVTLGKGSFVGEATVLDIGTELGERAQLGHTSSLHPGQAVPAGQSWHGSPAQPAEVTYRATHAAGCGPARRAGYSVATLLTLLLVSLPLTIGGAAALVATAPQLAASLGPGPLELTSWTFYRHALAVSSLLFFGGAVLGLLVVVAVPRVLNRALTPGKVYRLYGFHYGIHRTIARLTNRRFYAYLFGDSSSIVNYLRCLGYKLTPVEQTGSNFGLQIKHDNPFLSSVGTGTVVADGLSLVNADFSSTSFRVCPTSVGRHNFVGNNIAYPAQGRTGDNCLLATKVMIPIDGPVRENVGLLGSPSFEIPRTVARDSGFDVLRPDELRYRLAAKNRHNTVTMSLYLFVRWFHFFCLTVCVSCAVDLHHAVGPAGAALAVVLLGVFTVAYWVSVERACTRLQSLRPQGCSIYDEAFWRHERFWKLPSHAYIQAFDGTPFKPVIWRLLGVRIGRRVFDDGCELVEKTFVRIGDSATLNMASIVQTHSQEDGAFKSDHTAIGAGVTLGVGAFVHYGVTVGDGAALAADSFLMKGEEVPPQAHWGGNPARELTGTRRIGATTTTTTAITGGTTCPTCNR